MLGVKVGTQDGRKKSMVDDVSNLKEKLAVSAINIPTFNIQKISGFFEADSPPQLPTLEIIEQTSNKDFSHFIGNNTNMRELHSRLRHLAVLSFALALTASCLAIADIEVSKTTKKMVAQPLNCEDTFVGNYFGKCPALINPDDVIRDGIINQSVYDELEQHKTYFSRWIAAHELYAKTPWIAGIVLKSVITVLTVYGTYCTFSFHRAELQILKIRKFLPEDSLFIKSPKIRSFTVKTLVMAIHVPPLFDAWLDAELQLVVLIRLIICGIKVMKECNELRYHKLGNILSNLARIKIHGTFLLKTYFLRYPQTSLFIVYLSVVAGLPYFVMLAEYKQGYDVSFMDACWLMVVTVTNLGSGEVRPKTIPARIVVGLASLVGIVSTALWVNVISNYMKLPQEERRILALVEHQRVRALERKTAAKCIQAAWRLYHQQRRSTSMRNLHIVHLEKACNKAVWEWKCTRNNCDRIRRAIDQDFSTEDTLIFTKSMERKMSTGPGVTKERRNSHMLSPSTLQVGSPAETTRHVVETDSSPSSSHPIDRLSDSAELRHLAEGISSLKNELFEMKRSVSELNKKFTHAQQSVSLQFNDLKTLLQNEINTR